MGSGEGRGEAPLGALQPPQHLITQSFWLHRPHGPGLTALALHSFPLPAPGSIPSRLLGPPQPLVPCLHPPLSPWPDFRQSPGTGSAPHRLPSPWFHALHWRWSLMAPSPTALWSPTAPSPQPSSPYSRHGPEPHNPHHPSLSLSQPSPSQSPLIAPDAAQPQPFEAARLSQAWLCPAIPPTHSPIPLWMFPIPALSSLNPGAACFTSLLPGKSLGRVLGLCSWSSCAGPCPCLASQSCHHLLPQECSALPCVIPLSMAPAFPTSPAPLEIHTGPSPR